MPRNSAGVEHVVRQRHGSRQGDHVSREQRQFHAGLALGDAVAHRRHAAGNLRGGADLARVRADQRRITLVGLMRRKHVVVGGDDADVRRRAGAAMRSCRRRRMRRSHGRGCRRTSGGAWARRRVPRRCVQIGRACGRLRLAMRSVTSAMTGWSFMLDSGCRWSPAPDPCRAGENWLVVAAGRVGRSNSSGYAAWRPCAVAARLLRKTGGRCRPQRAMGRRVPTRAVMRRQPSSGIRRPLPRPWSVLRYRSILQLRFRCGFPRLACCGQGGRAVRCR